MEAFRDPSSSESVPPDVWTTAFTRRSKQREVPLISLTEWVFSFEDEDLVPPKSLTILKSGMEARPYLHNQEGMVYKLFDLRAHGALGRKISLEPNELGEFELTHLPANFIETLEKIQVLHDLGAHPTEILGLDETGRYFIVKQPYAEPQPYNTDQKPILEDHEAFHDDLRKAVAAIKGEFCTGHQLRTTVVVSILFGHPWIISDLHHKNIMRNTEGEPTIIDALIGPVSSGAWTLDWLKRDIAEATALRNGTRREKKKRRDDYIESEM